MTFWLLIFLSERKSLHRGEIDTECTVEGERLQNNRGKEKGDIKRGHERVQPLGTFAVKKRRHTLKQLTVIRPPEKQLVAWPRRGEREKTRDVILANTAASSCSPTPTQNHFVFLFASEKWGTVNLEVCHLALDER